MKKLMISMLAMAAMVSCSSEGILDNEEPVINGGLVPIKMTAEIGHLTTKAAIDQDATSGALNKDLENVYFLRSDETDAADWSTSVPLKATIQKGGDIQFSSPQYYDKNGSKKAYLIGYYPKATSTDNGIVKWTITGKEDIIISDSQSGSKTSTSPLKFTFGHQLTQLQFKVKAPTGETLTGEKLKSITVTDLRNEAQFDPSAASNQFSFTGEATHGLTTENPAKDTDLSADGIFGGTLLIESTGETTFNVEVTTDTANDDGSSTQKTYKGTVTIENEKGLQAQQSYEVNLTISQKEVSGTAEVGKWTSGGNGSGNII